MVSWPPANRLAAMRAASLASGVEPSGNVAVASPVSTSLRGRPAAILDVLVEALVEELERLVADVLVRGREPLAEERVVRLGHALEVGDDRERERLGVRADHFERALVEEARR